MRIIEIDAKRGILEVQIEDSTDLFVLWNFLREGDILEANTYRKIKFESGESDRIKIRLQIRVEKIGFQEMAEVLRVSGPIVAGPDKYVSIGSYHTVTLKRGMKIKIFRKQGFDESDLKILEEAEILSKINPLIIIAIERDEATIAVLFSTRINVIASVFQTQSYKDSANTKALKNMFFKKIFDIIANIMSQYQVEGIIIVGPGLTKNELGEFIKNNLKKKVNIIIDQASSGTLSAIYEVLRRGTILKIISNHKIAVAMKDYEEFLMHLGKNDNKAYYGLDIVEKLVEWGAAKKVYIVSDLVINEKTHGRILNIIKKAHQNNVKIEIISPNNPLYDNIRAFGGIIALLKYPIKIGDLSAMEAYR